MIPVLVSASETGLLTEDAAEETCDETGVAVGTVEGTVVGTVVGTAVGAVDDEAPEVTEPLLVIPSMLAGAEESGCDEKMSDAMTDPMSEGSAVLVICELMLISSSPGILQAGAIPTTADSITINVSRNTILRFFLCIFILFPFITFPSGTQRS